MQTEDLYIIIGELYVAQRVMQDERDKALERAAAAEMELIALNERREAGHEDA